MDEFRRQSLRRHDWVRDIRRDFCWLVHDHCYEQCRQCEISIGHDWGDRSGRCLYVRSNRVPKPAGIPTRTLPLAKLFACSGRIVFVHPLVGVIGVEDLAQISSQPGPKTGGDVQIQNYLSETGTRTWLVNIFQNKIVDFFFFVIKYLTPMFRLGLRKSPRDSILQTRNNSCENYSMLPSLLL